MTPATDNRPLARSLVPLPDEGLLGFLLRLSHRLDESPLQLAGRIGLTWRSGKRSAVPLRSLLQLEAPLLRDFAKAARLDERSAEDLTLKPFANRYPPLADALTPVGERAPLPPWLRLESTRFCPQCLAGDGSPIQNMHGGPWKRQWHLPVVFACLDHNAFLHHACPDCGHGPLQSGASSWAIPMTGVRNLHPAQCRRVTIKWSKQGCGTRLDQAPTNLPPLTPDIAALQQHLLDQLKTTAPATATQFFADLSFITTLILATGINRPAPAGPTGLLDSLDTHIDTQDKTAAGWRAARSRPRILDSWRLLPESAPATAALLSMAVDSLNLPLPDFRHQVFDLLSHAPDHRHPRWGNIWSSRVHKDCSPSRRREFLTALDRRSEAQRTEPRLLDVRPRGFWAEHVPQEIPLDSFTHHFGRTPRLGTRRILTLRRAVALHLVMSVDRVDHQEAARFLGIPAAWLDDDNELLSAQALLARPAHDNIRGGLERFGQHLANLPKRENYSARRKQFGLWHLRGFELQQLLNDAQVHPAATADQQRLQHDCLSAYIWSRLTGSEWRLATVMRPPYSPITRLARKSPEETKIRNLQMGLSGPAIRLARSADAFADALITDHLGQPLTPGR
ncbi:TniQ family protein [Kitasatospora sp. NPDC090308]|uniref:TniQ family protein n=1 Tax=Kitasatospora sp. NPDC090308 TaxID=3364082 RepID=UPI00380C6FEB